MKSRTIIQSARVSVSNGNKDVLKGLAAGLVGGLVASWTMNKFQAAWTRRAAGFEKPHGAQSMQPSEGERAAQTPEDKEQQDDAAVKVAMAISEEIFDRPLAERQKRRQARRCTTPLA